MHGALFDMQEPESPGLRHRRGWGASTGPGGNATSSENKRDKLNEMADAIWARVDDEGASDLIMPARSRDSLSFNDRDAGLPRKEKAPLWY